MNPRPSTDRHPIVTLRRRARVALAAVAGLVVGLALATSGGDALASEVDPGPLLSVDDAATLPGAERLGVLGAISHTTAFHAGAVASYESAESTMVTLPPRPSEVPSNNSTRNGLRVVFRRFGIVLIGGLFVVVRMGFSHLFRRR